MPEFMVAIDHITYYAVQAEDEVTAIDLVLEGQGLEIPPRHAMPISASIRQPPSTTPLTPGRTVSRAIPAIDEGLS